MMVTGALWRKKKKERKKRKEKEELILQKELIETTKHTLAEKLKGQYTLAGKQNRRKTEERRERKRCLLKA
tara:strand:- start:1739 stop:1951 length:213 start_codon:yes stop_codon:yes gene_type:complete